MKDPLSKPFWHFVDLLETHSICYAVIGGIAVSLLTEERLTKDVDFTIALDQERSNTLIALFRGDSTYDVRQCNFISSPDIPDFFRVFWEGTAVDLLVANTQFQNELIARSRSCEIENRSVPVATPEDMLILKLLADRPQDRLDVQSFLKYHTSLDWPYIEKWCRVWEIEERLPALRGRG